MKRGVLIAGAAAFFTACGNAPTDPMTTEVQDPRLKAEVITFLKGRFPIGARTVLDSCTGELVDIVGEFNLIVRQITSNSGHVNFMIHSVGGHVTGVGQTTGTEYISNEHFNFIQHSGGKATNLIIESTIRSVSKGPLPNHAIGKLQIFVVVNANGDLTVDRVVESGFDECQ